MAGPLRLTIYLNASENTICPSTFHHECIEAAIRGSDHSTASHVTILIRYFDVNSPQCLQLDRASLDNIRCLFPATTKCFVRVEMHLRAVDKITDDDVTLSVKVLGGLSLSQELVNAVARCKIVQNLPVLKGMQKLVWFLMEDGFVNVVVPWM